MILVRKSGDIPAELAENGRAATEVFCAAYRAGVRKFEFDSTIYGHPDVKTRLIRDQKDKCCYCESKVSFISFGDVEHFRPKGRVKQRDGDKLFYPGYYWLAYDWKNLFFSCGKCNIKYKRDLFPLVDPSVRARNHDDSIVHEQPLLVDPGGPDDPRDHIRFREASPEAKTDKGRKMIKIVGLRRADLSEERLERLDRLKAQGRIINLSLNGSHLDLQEEARRARTFLEHAIMPEAKYSSMATDYCIEAGVLTLNL